ncbi:TPA: hypothetical protein N0F65_008346 [Lagenidium giganteum]|uniref:BCNT-C domain-containing protein n=1 Tax=Lagenidium giganteum TaxID=4803 RepID=A0AAV2YV76_9STRA|nr:TPA: hypothetical protein N0F65_008346 [Lagenidium giganteum]
MSGSSSEDEDYVPEASVSDDEDDEVDERNDKKTRERATVVNARMDAMWEELNAPTNVSKSSSDRSLQLLKKLTQRSRSSKMEGRIVKKKKRKLHEFECPVLSLDVKKHRRDIAMAAATADTKVDQVVKFAGKEYSVTSKSGAPAKGTSKPALDQVLASLDEPKKVSTMEKTSMDWDKFKTDEGIEDELQQYTKDGYLEKQDFLTRLDHKRFEIEKAERDRQRRQQQMQQPPSTSM